MTIRLNWDDIYREYLRSGLSQSAFYNFRFPDYFDSGQVPSRSTFFRYIRRCSLKPSRPSPKYPAVPKSSATTCRSSSSMSHPFSALQTKRPSVPNPPECGFFACVSPTEESPNLKRARRSGPLP